MHLPFHRQWVDGKAHVLRDNQPCHARLARGLVHFDLGQDAREARRAFQLRRPSSPIDRLYHAAEAHKRLANLLQRDFTVGHASHLDCAINDFQVVGAGLQAFRRDAQHLLFGLMGRPLDRQPDGIGDLAAARRTGVGRGVTVAGHDAHLFNRYAERLGGDGGHRRIRAVQVHRANRDDQRAVAVHLTRRGRRFQPA